MSEISSSLANKSKSSYASSHMSNSDASSFSSSQFHPARSSPSPSREQIGVSVNESPRYWSGVSCFPLPMDYIPTSEEREAALRSMPHYPSRKLFAWQRAAPTSVSAKDANNPGGMTLPRQQKTLLSKVAIFNSIDKWYTHAFGGKGVKSAQNKLENNDQDLADADSDDDDDDDDDLEKEKEEEEKETTFVETGLRITFPFLRVSRATAAFLREQLVAKFAPSSSSAAATGLPNFFGEAILLTCYCASVPQPFTFQRFFYPCRHCRPEPPAPARRHKPASSAVSIDFLDGGGSSRGSSNGGIGDSTQASAACPCTNGMILVQHGYQFFGVQTTSASLGILDDVSMTDAERIMWTTPMSPAMHCDLHHPQGHLVQKFADDAEEITRMRYAIPTMSFPLASDPKNELDFRITRTALQVRLYTPLFGGECIPVPNNEFLKDVFACISSNAQENTLLFAPDQYKTEFVQTCKLTFENLFHQLSPTYQSLRLYLALRSPSLPKLKNMTKNELLNALHSNYKKTLRQGDQDLFSNVGCPFVRCIVHGPGSGFCDKSPTCCSHRNSLIEIFFFRMEKGGFGGRGFAGSDRGGAGGAGARGITAGASMEFIPAVYCPACIQIKFYPQYTVCDNIPSTAFLFRQLSILVGSSKDRSLAVQLNLNDFSHDNGTSDFDETDDDEDDDADDDFDGNSDGEDGDGRKGFMLYDNGARFKRAQEIAREELFDPQVQARKQTTLQMLNIIPSSRSIREKESLSNALELPAASKYQIKDQMKKMVLAHSDSGVYLPGGPQPVIVNHLLEDIGRELQSLDFETAIEERTRASESIDELNEATNERMRLLNEERLAILKARDTDAESFDGEEDEMEKEEDEDDVTLSAAQQHLVQNMGESDGDGDGDGDSDGGMAQGDEP